MIEKRGDVLNYETGNPKTLRVFTSNGIVKFNDELVMGAGIALAFRNKFPTLARTLGRLVRAGGNHVYVAEELGVASFPTKEHFKDPSILALIEQSCKELVEKSVDWDIVLLPRPGTQNGKLDWKDVKPILEKYLTSDKFLVLSL